MISGDEKMTELDMTRIPKHIAIILDGNGRWAKKRLLPRTYGHRKGAFNINNIAEECNNLGIQYLTLYCFSTENWSRPKDEVDYLMKAPERMFKKLKKQIANSSIRWQFIGRRDRFNDELLGVINEIEQMTKDHTGLTLAICFDYGSYEEITTAVKHIAEKVKDNEIEPKDINPQMISDNLYTKGFPKLDLLIRTSGEQRLSNFLLWQMSYAELYFTDTLWPDFSKEDLIKALVEFQGRKRRFGGLNENK